MWTMVVHVQPPRVPCSSERRHAHDQERRSRTVTVRCHVRIGAVTLVPWQRVLTSRLPQRVEVARREERHERSNDGCAARFGCVDEGEAVVDPELLLHACYTCVGTGSSGGPRLHGCLQAPVANTGADAGAPFAAGLCSDMRSYKHSR